MYLFARLLELLPLRGCEDALKALVRLPANLCDARLCLLVERAQLFTRVAENLAHLRPLLVAQLQAVE